MDEKTWNNDRNWLESIIRNYAPFSDGWTKARIIQLAYPNPPGTASPTTEEIVATLRSLCDLKQYAMFAEKVNEDYVINTLNRWHNRQFTQAFSRNFEVYADSKHPNVFLVSSTASTSLNVDRELPPERFRPLFNVDELAQIVLSSGCDRLTMRIHGYATPGSIFYNNFINEADSLTLQDPINNVATLEKNNFYIGYHWPSEKPFVSPGLWADYRYNWGIIIKFLVVLGGLTIVSGSLLYISLKLLGIPLLLSLGSLPELAGIWQWLKLRETAELAVQWHWIILTVFMLSLLVVQMMRIIVYQRDRYRAIHYGSPDFSEFFWRLDRALAEENQAVQAKFSHDSGNLENDRNKRVQIPKTNPRIAVNLMGHSLGALVVVNSLRILSDRFGKDDIDVDDNREMGDYLTLDKLIMSAPDIPLEFLREGRNNYVRSAILRCQKIYLFSSDRDIVLRYLSTLANWWVEPSLEMSGLRLGNIYLKEVNEGLKTVNKSEDPTKSYVPYIRIMVRSQLAANPTSAYELFEKFNYIDCSEMMGVNSVKLPLNKFTAIPIDLINSVAFLFGKIDAHGGYFRTDSPSFAAIKFLLKNHNISEEDMQAGINSLIDNSIRFWPSQPLLCKK
ncbi:alpha/beta hydrolase [Kamptonema sp. UHCC 0994]|uniref:alpha/beta hydrolase n=1 Tax=Kamptonema sp. UHCC 0994 TaxID=3031329 RepID=UPI0023BAC1DB|nr:alpha/beta hydrolase [Kamptonema sp. UHCC 0994]MDF0556925.1 alpha/beta hydrolase [Kamptonema sp. UHCC 0994]